MTVRTRSLLVPLAVLVLAAIMLSSSPRLIIAQSSHSVMQVTTTMTSQNATSSATTSTTSNSTGFIENIVNSVKAALAPYIGEPPHMPESTLFTVVIAIGLGLASSTAAKLLVDYEMVRNSMREATAWRKDMEKAKKANDNQAISKLMKKQQAITKLQARASMEQFKVTAVTFVPFLLLWYLLSAVFGREIVAFAPFPLPLVGDHLNFVAWYFLSSFAVNFPIMRVFGIGMGEN